MNKITATYLCVLLFLFSSFLDLSKSRLEVFRQISQNVEQKGLGYEKLKAATDNIGHRLTGSENGRKGEAFALKTFKEFGYSNARFMPFETETWMRNRVTLSVVPANSDNFREVKVISLAHSPVSSTLAAKMVDCKDGLESDFESLETDLTGQVALFNIEIQTKENQGKKNLHRSEKTALAIKHGAVGVIAVNSVRGEVLLTGTASVTGSLIPIPAVCVSYESGRAIRKWIRDEKKILAQIDMLNYFGPVRARNVVAEHKGQSKFSHQKIVVGGHLDSWDLAQGAVDNGIGAFSVLDIARVFNSLKLKTKRPIEFVLFMGEEQGTLGSKYYMEKAKKEGTFEDIALMINLDMINDTKGFNAFGNEELYKFFAEIGKEIQGVDEKFQNHNLNEAGLHSDHESFMINGIPVCSPEGNLSQKALDCYHADCDSFGLIDKDELNNNVKYTAMMLYALANADKLPKRKTSEETRDYLIAQNLKQELILGESWLWEK